MIDLQVFGNPDMSIANLYFEGYVKDKHDIMTVIQLTSQQCTMSTHKAIHRNCKE